MKEIKYEEAVHKFLFRKRNVSLINLLFGCMVRIFCLLL